MVPTLRPGDRLYVDPAAYRSSAPAPGEVVVVHDPELPSRWLVKRVALPPGSAELSASTVFLLGDDPAASRDSRSFGPVPRSLVVGRVYRCYAPPERRREL